MTSFDLPTPKPINQSPFVISSSDEEPEKPATASTCLVPDSDEEDVVPNTGFGPSLAPYCNQFVYRYNLEKNLEIRKLPNQSIVIASEEKSEPWLSEPEEDTPKTVSEKTISTVMSQSAVKLRRDRVRRYSGATNIIPPTEIDKTEKKEEIANESFEEDQIRTGSHSAFVENNNDQYFFDFGKFLYFSFDLYRSVNSFQMQFTLITIREHTKSKHCQTGKLPFKKNQSLTTRKIFP